MIAYEDLPAISVYDLAKLGAFQPDARVQCTHPFTLAGNFGAQVSIAVYTNHAQPFITITGMFNGQNRSVNINLISRPFNLNKGVLWHFICPSTGIHCRKLFYYEGSFLHRKAIPGTYSKNNYTVATRNAVTNYNNILVLASLAKKATAPYFRPVYAGKPTKTYKKIVNKIKAT